MCGSQGPDLLKPACRQAGLSYQREKKELTESLEPDALRLMPKKPRNFPPPSTYVYEYCSLPEHIHFENLILNFKIKNLVEI